MACLSPATSPRQAVLDNVPLASVAENAHECVGCGGIDNLSVLGPCEHHVCRRCIVSSLPEDGASPQNVSIAICPACKVPIAHFSPPKGIKCDMLFTKPSAPSPSDSPPPRLRRTFSDASATQCVIRICNFPWVSRALDLEAFVSAVTGTSRAHILQNRQSSDGRTNSAAFVEYDDNGVSPVHVAELLNGQLFFSRAVAVYPSSQQEMCEQIFPSWLPGWNGSRPSFLLDGNSFSGHFVEVEEIKGLMELCKLNSPVAQRTPERPFLQFATIIDKLPWRQRNLFTDEFSRSIMQHAQHALKTLMTNAAPLCPHWPMVASRLATSIFDCPAATESDIEVVRRLIAAYWPVPPAVALGTSPRVQPVGLVGVPIVDTTLLGRRGSYDPPQLTYEYSHRMRRCSSDARYPAIAGELGVDEALVRAIAHRLHFS